MELKIGNKYEHILTGDYVLLLEKGNEQYKIRLKDYREVWVYKFELKEIKK